MRAAPTSKAGAVGFGRRTRGTSGQGARPPAPACARAGRRRECRCVDRRAAACAAQPGHRPAARSATAAVCAPARRRAVRRAPRRASASIGAASSAALTAPGLADRQRADRNARRHLDDGEQAVLAATAPCDSTGTPNTGSGVSAAVMPGRCAAPPAPAMITLKPAALRALGEIVRGGPACGGPRRSAPRARRRARRAISAACRMVAQSDWLPMMMATGFIAVTLRAARGPRRSARLPGRTSFN